MRECLYYLGILYVFIGLLDLGLDPCDKTVM